MAVFSRTKSPDKTSTVEVRSLETGRTVRIEVDADPGMAVAVIDFAGKDRVLIGMTRANVYEDIPGDWDVMVPTASGPWVYQVWDVASHKPRREEFTAPAFAPTRAGFSPGRNYMVIQEQEKAGHRLVFYDLRTGNQAGSLPVQAADNPRGHPAGLAFSHDGKQLALLWRLNERPERWGQLMCWDVATGKKLLEHDIGYLVSSMEFLWSRGGSRSIQWLPDGQAGLAALGHLVIRREDGALIRKIPPEPQSAPRRSSSVSSRHPDRFTSFRQQDSETVAANHVR